MRKKSNEAADTRAASVAGPLRPNDADRDSDHHENQSIVGSAQMVRSSVNRAATAIGDAIPIAVSRNGLESIDQARCNFAFARARSSGEPFTAAAFSSYRSSLGLSPGESTARSS